MEKNLSKEYENSLKSIETENIIDRWFYRPMGFRIAKSLVGTNVTPNAVTVLSIFVGVSTGILLYYQQIYLSIIGIICLIFANILDCVDGQLARMTNIKSEIGRILDGIAGDIWFASIYIFLALRLNKEFNTSLFWFVIVLSAASHLIQACITDYYKTLHLFFVSKEKGKEFQNASEVREQHKNIKPGLSKTLFLFYKTYTIIQEKSTPWLQKMLKFLQTKYGEDIPQDVRLTFREQSSRLMKRYIDFMTFNGRTIILFISVLIGCLWIYFIYEIIILNMILFLSIRKHENICKSMITD